MNIFDFLKNLFQHKSKDQNKVPFLHESIDLKSFPVEEVDLWIAKGGFTSISSYIQDAFRNYAITGKSVYDNQLVTILQDAFTYGWLLDCNRLTFESQSYNFLAFALSDILKKNKYTIQLAEQKSIARDEGVEMIVHYYLKPSLRVRIQNDNSQVPQLYGNISIEFKAINGVPYSFKFLTKAYSDSKYTPPLAFSELHSTLFD